MAEALGGTLTLFLIIAAGFFMARGGWITAENEPLLVKLALYAAVPCALYANAVKYLKADVLAPGPSVWLLPFGSILAALGLALLSARLLGVGRERFGLTASVFSMSNTIIIGLPVATAMFHEAAIPYIMLYYAANTVIFWTLGSSMIAADGGSGNRERGAKKLLGALGRIFSPALVCFLLGILTSVSGIALPGPVMSAVSAVGAMNMPLCMLVIGASVSRMRIREVFSLGWAGILALSGRMLLTPALTLLICRAAGIPALPASVFTIMAAMPAMNQSVLVAKRFHSDDALAARLLSASALLMPVFLPLWRLAAGFVFGAVG